MLYGCVVDPKWFIPDPGPTFQGILDPDRQEKEDK